MWTLITGTPTNFSSFLKYEISFQVSGSNSFKMSTDNEIQKLYQNRMSHGSLISLRIANRKKRNMVGLGLFFNNFERIPNSKSKLASNYVTLVRQHNIINSLIRLYYLWKGATFHRILPSDLSTFARIWSKLISDNLVTNPRSTTTQIMSIFKYLNNSFTSEEQLCKSELQDEDR